MREFDKVWVFIKNNGTLVNEAQSSYGADRWEMPNGLTATLEDDGYTRGIFATKIKARQTAGFDIVFHFGTEKELKELSEYIKEPS
ncbi:MAG: hypothetical protein GY755_22210 [Chloroflexi bacterium]|nr:hypothetical protein [Chloroflexota bacterium]